MLKEIFLIFTVILFLQINYAFAKVITTIKDIPARVLKSCFDYQGRIADVGAAWNPSDVGAEGPHARLLAACQIKEDSWIIACEKGGIAHQYFTVEIHRENLKAWGKPRVKKFSIVPSLKCP